MTDSCAKLLAEKQLTITFIESASAGYLSHRFSLSPYSGDVLIGGLVCYDLQVKEQVLNIPSELIDKYTAESLQVTEALVHKAKSLFESDLYVACTGLLKRGGSETKDKPVGTFFYCIDYQGETFNFRSLCKGEPLMKLHSLNSVICKSIIDIVTSKRD